MAHRGGPTPVVGRIRTCRRNAIRTTAPGSCRRARARAASANCGSRASSAGSRSNRFSARLPATRVGSAERPLTAVVPSSDRSMPGCDTRQVTIREGSAGSWISAVNPSAVMSRLRKRGLCPAWAAIASSARIARVPSNIVGSAASPCFSAASNTIIAATRRRVAGRGAVTGGLQTSASRKPPDPARGSANPSGAIGEQLLSYCAILYRSARSGNGHRLIEKRRQGRHRRRLRPDRDAAPGLGAARPL